MWPTREDAIKNLARYWCARHCAKAVESARDAASQLAEKGDLEGASIWGEVADGIERFTITNDTRRTVA